MTISVHTRIAVTTPDGRTHTGVVTGLRGQGMADLRLDDGRQIRQPVGALRLLTTRRARTNGAQGGTDEVNQFMARGVALMKGVTADPNGKTPEGKEAAKQLAAWREAYKKQLGELTNTKLTAEEVRQEQKEWSLADVAETYVSEDDAGLRYHLFHAELRLRDKGTSDEDQYKAQRLIGTLLGALWTPTKGPLDKRTPLTQAQFLAMQQQLHETERKRDRHLDNIDKLRALEQTWSTQLGADPSAQLLAEALEQQKQLLAVEEETVKQYGRQISALEASSDTSKDTKAAEKARLEKTRLEREAEAVRTGKRESLTAEGQQLRERQKQLGGVDLAQFIEKQRAAYRILPDPVRTTRNGRYLCGNALDGHAYTLATSGEQRAVSTWLTWRDLGVLPDGQLTNNTKFQVGPSREERQQSKETRQKPEPFTLQFMAKKLQESDSDYVEFDLRLTSNPAERFNARVTKLIRRDNKEYQPKRVDIPFAAGPNILGTTYAWQIKPDPGKVRSESQKGSSLPTRPLPPEPKKLGTFSVDDPLIDETHAGELYAIYASQRKTVALTILNTFAPYSKADPKSRNPYFSFVPETAGQFSAAATTAPAARPCADPRTGAQLRAMERTYSTLAGLVQTATRLHNVLVSDNGAKTVAVRPRKAGEAPGPDNIGAIERAVAGVIKQSVRVARLNKDIVNRRFVEGFRQNSSTDFSVYDEPESLLREVAAAPDVTEAQIGKLRESLELSQDILAQLSYSLEANHIIARAEVITKKKKADAANPEYDFTPADAEEYLASAAANLAEAAVLLRPVQSRSTDVNPPFELTPAYANKNFAPFILTCGVLARGARLIDVFLSLISSPEQLIEKPPVQEGTLGEVMPPKLLAATFVGLARTTPTELLSNERIDLAGDRTQKGMWATALDALLLEYGPGRFGNNVLSATRFAQLITFLVERERAALVIAAESDYAPSQRSSDPLLGWDGFTNTRAAAALYFYSITFFCDPKVGGALTTPEISLDTDALKMRGNPRMPRAYGQRFAFSARRNPDDLGELRWSRDVQGVRREASRLSRPGYAPAEPLSADELAQARGAQKRAKEMGRVERRTMGRELAAQSEAQAEEVVAQRRARVAEEVKAQALQRPIAGDAREAFELAQNALRGGGTLQKAAPGTTIQYTYNPLLFQLVRLYYKSPYQDNALIEGEKLQDSRAQRQMARAAQLRDEINTLRAQQPPTEAYYKTREKELAQAEKRGDPNARMQRLALSLEPGAQASAHRERQEKIKVLEQELADLGAAATAPDTRAERQAARLTKEVQQLEAGEAPSKFRGFFTPKGTDPVSEPLRFMIDWIGTYGALLQIVRECALLYEYTDRDAPKSWAEVHEGWATYFMDKPQDEKDKVPYEWLDLLPLAWAKNPTGRGLWLAAYRAISEDRSGEKLKERVLSVKGQALAGLTYAGQLGRRGYDTTYRPNTDDEQRRAAIDTSTQFTFMRRGREVETPRTLAIAELLEELAPAFIPFCATTVAADFWDQVKKGVQPILHLVHLSLTPLTDAGVLPATVAAHMRDAMQKRDNDGKLTLNLKPDIVIDNGVMRAYVDALFRLRAQTQATEAGTYPRAPRDEALQPFRVTAADTGREPEQSFLHATLDREAMRKQLLTLIDNRLRGL
jgi:hypothetical protein